MKGQRAAVRYARSLMQLARENSLLEDIKSDMELILRAIDENNDLKIFLGSPLIKIEKKKSILNKIFEGKVNEMSMKFIHLVADQKREENLERIAQEFIRQYNQEHNIATVHLTTAKVLNDGLREEILNFIKAKYEFSKVELKEEVNEDLIGGLVIRIEDQQIDGSVRRKLQDIKQELIQA